MWDCRDGPDLDISSFPPFLFAKKGSSRDVGRNGSGEEMSGHGWRRGGKKEKGGGGRYLSGLEEDGGEEKGLEEVNG